MRTPDSLLEVCPLGVGRALFSRAVDNFGDACAMALQATLERVDILENV